MKNTKYENRDVKGIIYGKVIYGRTRHEESLDEELHCSETLILSLNLTFKQYHRPSYSFERVSSDHTRSFVSIKNVSILIYLLLNQINAIGQFYYMTDVATISYKMMLHVIEL